MNNLFKSHNLFILGLLTILILFFCINALIPVISDDILYCYIFPKDPGINDTWGVDINQPIMTIGDIVKSQYNHYFHHGGRVLIHSLVQFFASFEPKSTFALVSTFFFAFLTFLLGKCSFSNEKQNYVLYFLPIAIFMVLFVHPYCFYNTIACSINYLWSAVVCLQLWFLFSNKTKDNVLKKIIMLFIALLAGLSHEAIVIPLGCILAFFWIFEIRSIKDWRTLVILIYGCAAIFLIMAPGNFERQGGRSFSLYRLVLFCLFFRVLYVLILVILLTYWKFGKELILKWYNRNKSIIWGILVPLPFFAYYCTRWPKSIFGIELFSTILLCSLIEMILKYKNISMKTIGVASYVIVLILFSIVTFYQFKASEQIEKVVSEVEMCNSDHAYIHLYEKTPRFMAYYVTPVELYECDYWNREIWEVKYGKKITYIYDESYK